MFYFTIMQMNVLCLVACIVLYTKGPRLIVTTIPLSVMLGYENQPFT